ncbi:MAG: hypothetical protein JSU90_01140 [Nitrospiraceae bacterium]|nr:MAG: hypothetical protein JSU90_01140 [Nitrospiraceae bacterium]
MSDMKKEIEKPEIFHAVRDSIGDARESIQKLGGFFSETVRVMRVEESEAVFNALVRNISDLECFMEFIGELRDALRYYSGFGMAHDPMSSAETGLNLFQEMHKSLESRDWILLSDLIEYELCPILVKEDAWLGDLHERMQDHEGTGTARTT